MAAHAPECEKADPGSLCDCDCAGARHAIRRTAGNVPGAGQVSKRAQQIAARDGRASVVNNRAKPGDEPDEPGVHRKAGRHRPDATAPVVKIDPTAPVRTSSAPPRLSPTTAARLRTVAAGLPKDKAGWQAAAREPLGPAEVARLNADLDRHKATAAAAAKAYDDHFAEFARTVVAKEFTRKQKPGYRQYKRTDPDFMETMLNFAQHRMYDKGNEQFLAEHTRLSGEKYNAEDTLRQAERAFTERAKGAYPRDPGTGYRMPTAALRGHLDAVKQAGRAALADAKRAWEKNPPAAVRAAQAKITRHAQCVTALATLARRRDLAAQGRTFSVDLPDEGRLVVRDKEQFDALQIKYATDLIAVGGVDALRDAKQTIAAHEAQTLRTMLAQHRAFGGRHSTVSAERDTFTESRDTKKKFGVTNPRADWRERLTVAEQHFPADWITASGAKPLKVGASERAYYGGSNTADLLSMRGHQYDEVKMSGALGYVDEVNVHELGHRMEQMIPGLSHLEFAYVRERGRTATGAVQPITSIKDYEDKTEVAQEDNWGNPYVGKSYEVNTTDGTTSDTPGNLSWEVFQTGLQDTFGRGGVRFGPTDDPEELQAFVIGALLTLG